MAAAFFAFGAMAPQEPGPGPRGGGAVGVYEEMEVSDFGRSVNTTSVPPSIRDPGAVFITEQHARDVAVL